MHEKWMNTRIIVGIPLLTKALLLDKKILEFSSRLYRNYKRESTNLHDNIIIFLRSLFVVIHSSYYVVNPCFSASTRYNDCFPFLVSSSYAVLDNIPGV